MEESPPKRRRTSPRTSQPIPRDTTSGREESTAPSRNKRPSYASPTKASLGRYNPEILERRRSASPNKSSPTRPAARGRLSDAASEQSVADLLTAQLESDAASAPASDASRPLRRSPRSSSGPTSPVRALPRVAGSLAGTPRRSPAKPIPRPLPAPAPEGEDDLNPFIGHTLRRSPTTGVNIPPRPEPELPPSVPDVVSSTPPRGIHTSSPSRWREKSKPVRESPLKRPPLRQDDNENETGEPAAKRLFPGRPTKSNVRATSVLGQVSDNPRRVVPYDPNSKKRKRVEKLREQVRKLEADLRLVEAENDRIRAAQGSGRSLGLINEKGTLAAVRRHLVPGADQHQHTQTELLAKAARNPMGLMSLTRPVRSFAPTASSEDPLEGIKSHFPVVMSAETELPYLQLFGSFDVTSTVAIMPPIPDGTLRQRHMISLRSRHAPGLFAARIEMVVNAMDLSILDLRIAALEPTARAELGGFLGRVCSGDCNRSMQRNIGIVTWAMGDWLRVALQRATFWARLDRELHDKDGLARLAAKARRHRSRNRSSSDEDSEEAEVSNHDLLRFMGQQDYDLPLDVPEANSVSTIRLQWKIGCDWTGEAESTIDVSVGAPGIWHHADTQGAIGKLPKLFRDLVEGGEPTDVAVRAVVALMIGGK